jgi:hypothetical protein
MEGKILTQLLEWLAKEPKDIFLQYAVAMEYKKFDVAKAIEILEQLRCNEPQYLPTYYILAELYVEKQQNEQAKIVYEAGIMVAKEQKEQKTLAELQNAYTNFLIELE